MLKFRPISWQWWQILLVSLLVSLFVELGVCNYFYFLQFVQDYQKVTLLDSALRYESPTQGLRSMQQNKPLAEGPALVKSDSSAISVKLASVPIRNIRIDLYHPLNPRAVVPVEIWAATTEQKYLPHQVGFGRVATRSQELNNLLLPDRPVVTELQVKLNLPANSSIYVSGIIVNDDLSLQFNFLRFFLCLLVLALPWLVLSLGLHKQICDLELRSHRLLNLGCLVFNLAMVVSVLLLNNPITGANRHANCIFPQQCAYDYGSPQNTLLQQPPQNYQELFNAHIYTQQFDAWLKGQTYLDVKVDPRIREMEDIYDLTEFYNLQVGWLFDHVIYKERYYNYYGVAPLLLVYAPVYALTGQYPTPILTMTIMAALSVLMLHFAFSTWYRCFRMEGSLVLFLLCQIALACASGMFYLQTSFTATNYPQLSGIGAMAGVVGCGYAAWMAHSWKRCLWSIATGLCVVLVVLSRPHELFVVMFFFVPLVAAVYRQLRYGPDADVVSKTQKSETQVSKTLKTQNWRQRLLEICDFKALACLVLVLGVGAVGVMYYNYVRFDSVFNFGEKLMVTASVNVSKHQPNYDLANVLDALYNIVWDNSHANFSYPFVEMQEPSEDIKTYHSYPGPYAGLLSFKLNFALFLLLLGRSNFRQENGLSSSSSRISTLDWPMFKPYSEQQGWYVSSAQSALFTTFMLIALASLLIGVFNVIWAANLLLRYMWEGAWCLAFVSSMILLGKIRYTGYTSNKILFAVGVYVLVCTILWGYCLQFKGEHALVMHPETRLWLFNLFRPFLVTG